MHRRDAHDLRDVCAQAGEGDGMDPRHERRAWDRAKKDKVQRKDAQLAKHVLRIVEQLLATTSAGNHRTPVVMGAQVHGAGSHVTVILGGWPGSIGGSYPHDALANAARAELARLLNRKRTPTISLRYCDNSASAAAQEPTT